jgi:hypothetical protein
MFSSPDGVAAGAGFLYVADSLCHTIRKVALADGMTSTLAGGPGLAGFNDSTIAGDVRFDVPTQVALSGNGTVIVADTENQRIRAVGADGATVTLAGDGTMSYLEGVGTATELNAPGGVAVDASGNVYVSDTGNHCIRVIPAGGGRTYRLAGACTMAGATDGAGIVARFDRPGALAFDGSQYLYVADKYNKRIRKVSITDGATTTVFQSTTAIITGVALDSIDNVYYVDGSTIDRVDSGGGSTLVAGAGLQYADGPGCTASFWLPVGLVAVGNALFVGDTVNNRLRRIQLP